MPRWQRVRWDAVPRPIPTPRCRLKSLLIRVRAVYSPGWRWTVQHCVPTKTPTPNCTDQSCPTKLLSWAIPEFPPPRQDSRKRYPSIPHTRDKRARHLFKTNRAANPEREHSSRILNLNCINGDPRSEDECKDSFRKSAPPTGEP